MTEKIKKLKKTYTGIVVSATSDKTILVRVDTVKIHPVYKKQYVSSKKYMVHDEKNEAKNDNEVVFQDCRPLSKGKKWRLIEIKK